jgi:hypothetical protein
MLDRTRFLSRIVVPMAWERLSHTPTPEEHAALHAANEGVLTFLLRDVEWEATQRSPDERLMEALAPVHAKLDMIIALLGRVRYDGYALPAAIEIEFALDRIAWTSPDALPPTTWLCFRLYFHPTFLEPVMLHGRVSECTADSEGSYRVEAFLAALPEAHDTALGRLAFLTHRRQQAKSAARGMADG